MSENPDGRRVRGPAKPKPQAIHDLVGRELLDWLKRGRPVLDRATGAPKLDADGKEVRRDVNAAEMDCILKYLRASGAGRPATRSGADLIAEAQARLADGRLRFHPASEDGPAEQGGELR